jgi:Mannose-6-phosphate isomerase
MTDAPEKELGRAAVKDMLPMQPGDVTDTFADVGHLMSDVGFRLETSIEDGLCGFVAWYNAAKGQSVFEDSVSSDRALVALEDADDLVVVATQDAVLVSRQKDANGLKRLVAKLKTVAPEVTQEHLKVDRPWGSNQSADMGERHQVKCTVIKPGGRLSRQNERARMQGCPFAHRRIVRKKWANPPNNEWRS